MKTFKKSKSFAERKAESERIRGKYPDRIPTIVEKQSSGKEQAPSIDRTKFLVPADLTVGQFIYTIRKRMTLKPEQQIFIFFNGKALPPAAALMSEMYKIYKDEDGFLYTAYSLENTFG